MSSNVQSLDQAPLADMAASILSRIRTGRRCAWLPVPLAYRIGSHLSTHAGHNLPGPEAAQQAVFSEWMKSVVQASASELTPDTHQLWQHAKAAYGVSMVNLALHANRLAAIARNVVHTDTAWLQLMQNANGALVLTLHHDFHHTLFALAGHAGQKVRVIAAPEESSPLHAWLGPSIHRMHRDCARHFNGGDYLFLDVQASGTQVAKALKQKECVFSLHDFSAPDGTRSRPACLFGRTFTAPTGALDLAQALNKPVYFATLVWVPDRRGYHLHCEALPTDTSPLDTYTQAMTRLLVRFPWAWSGWQWFQNWPPTADHPPHAS